MEPSVFGEICSWAQEDEVELSEEALVAIAINTKCAVVNITFMFSNKFEFIRRNNQQTESRFRGDRLLEEILGSMCECYEFVLANSSRTFLFYYEIAL